MVVVTLSCAGVDTALEGEEAFHAETPGLWRDVMSSATSASSSKEYLPVALS